MGAVFAFFAIGVTVILSLGKSAPPTTANGPSGFSFPAGVSQDAVNTAAVDNFFELALNRCEVSATATLQQKGATVDAALSTKVNRYCGCAVDHLTANLTNDDVHTASLTAHVQQLESEAVNKCRP